MKKRTMLAAALAAGAMAVAGFLLTNATAGAQETPDINIGNNACVLPWMWNGPANVLHNDTVNNYEACKGADSAAGSGEGINVGNNACIAPWNWNGPGNVGLSDNTSTYSACGTAAGGPEEPGDPEDPNDPDNPGGPGDGGGDDGDDDGSGDDGSGGGTGGAAPVPTPVEGDLPVTG